jgi:hypothetical protein
MFTLQTALHAQLHQVTCQPVFGPPLAVRRSSEKLSQAKKPLWSIFTTRRADLGHLICERFSLIDRGVTRERASNNLDSLSRLNVNLAAASYCLISVSEVVDSRWPRMRLV